MESNKNVTVLEEKSSRVWPVDMIGNPVKKFGLAMVTFPSASVICRVAGAMSLLGTRR
jgi:hypothetical protein